jgi:hypothetical protein
VLWVASAATSPNPARKGTQGARFGSEFGGKAYGLHARMRYKAYLSHLSLLRCGDRRHLCGIQDIIFAK